MSAEQEVNPSSTIMVCWLTLGEAQRLLQNCSGPEFSFWTLHWTPRGKWSRSSKNSEGWRQGTKRNCIQIMMRTGTMLAGMMRNHIEITAGKSTRPRRTNSVIISKSLPENQPVLAGQIAGLTWQEHMWYTCDIAGRKFESLMMISLVFCLINMRFQ